MQGGPLHERVAFEAYTSTDDGYGGQVQAWAEVFQTRARFQYLRGGESVQASRLAGNQVIVATIRNSSAAALVNTEYRMRDVRSGKVYNVRNVEPNKDQPRQYIDVMAESGVAT